MKLKNSKDKNKIPNESSKSSTASSEQDLIDFKQDPSADADFIGKNWKVLIVDDEPGIHDITRFILKGFTFDGKGLQLVSAYSAKEAREALQREQNFAVALIDVVMETEEAGLDLVHFIREKMGLSHIRLIIRTGQPGKAPEQFVINNYDIDDYKEKTELTSMKMQTMFRSSIKSYRNILTIERSRAELDQKVKERTQELYEANKALERVIVDLQRALGEVKTLSGLLPICMHCKNIRDDKGYWRKIEAYIDEHSDVEFTHSICKDCVEKYYPDVDLDDDDDT